MSWLKMHWEFLTVAALGIVALYYVYQEYAASQATDQSSADNTQANAEAQAEADAEQQSALSTLLGGSGSSTISQPTSPSISAVTPVSAVPVPTPVLTTTPISPQGNEIPVAIPITSPPMHPVLQGNPATNQLFKTSGLTGRSALSTVPVTTIDRYGGSAR